MTFKEERKALFEKIKGKAFVYDNIPCYVESESKISLSYSRCPKCACHIMDVYVTSPAEYWQNFCGREGCVTICTRCGGQSEFKLLRMN